MTTAWDKNEPQGGRSLKSSDEKLRTNFANLEEALGREHIFPGNDGALGDSALHKEGSARVFARLTPTLSAFSNAKASSLGMVMYDLTTKRVYFCSDGATDTWVEVGTIGEALEISKALTASGGIFLPPSALIVGPQSENWLGEGIEIDTISIAASAVVKTKIAHGITNGDTVRIGGSDCTPTIDGDRVATVIDADEFSVPVTTTVGGNNGQVARDFMDPHLHAARHDIDGLDPLHPWAIQQVLQSTRSGQLAITSGFQTAGSISWTPKATTGLARCLLLGELQWLSANGIALGSMSRRFVVDGVAVPASEVPVIIGHTADNVSIPNIGFELVVDAPTGGAITVLLEYKGSATVSSKLDKCKLVLIDLGQA